MIAVFRALVTFPTHHQPHAALSAGLLRANLSEGCWQVGWGIEQIGRWRSIFPLQSWWGLEKWWRMGRAVDIVKWLFVSLFLLLYTMIYISLLVDAESVDRPFLSIYSFGVGVCKHLASFSRYNLRIIYHRFIMIHRYRYLSSLHVFATSTQSSDPHRSPTRQWLRAWASCIWRSSSIAWSASLRWRQRSESLKWPIVRPSLSPLSCGTLTRSRLEVLDSMSLADQSMNVLQ